MKLGRATNKSHLSHRRPLIADDGGFTSVGVVIAVLLTAALLFSSAQVYWVNSNAPDIQFAADAGALAAENVVAEYVICAQVADGVVLSLSLLGTCLLGVGAVAACIPYVDTVAPPIINAARSVLRARDNFSTQAVKSLNTVQKALPYLCALNASTTIAANGSVSTIGAGYVGIAIPVPLEGEEISIFSDDASEALADVVDGNQETVSESSSRAEDSRKEVDAAKLAGYMADCGSSPSMHERAGTLAGLSGSANPYYRSAEEWGFEVPIQRAKDYYRARIAQEMPASDNPEEVARSIARARFYRYALAEVMGNGVQVDSAGVKTAHMVYLPCNTSDIRGTELYAEAIYPVSSGGGAGVLHASSSCPGCQGVVGSGSVADVDSGALSECPVCHFDAVTLGKVAAASTSIENGFEHHYRKVAEAANRYSEATKVYHEKVSTVKRHTTESMDAFKQALAALGGKRIEIRPPGRFGCVAIAIDAGSHEAPASLGAFTSSSAHIGPRVAISAAMLAPDAPEKGANVISSLLSNIAQGEGVLSGAGMLDQAIVMWGNLLLAYANGTESVIGGISGFIDAIPLIGSDKLSAWAEEKLRDTLELVGLSPMDMSSYKPVLVNTVHVLDADTSGVGSKISQVREGYTSLGGDGSGTLLGALASLFKEKGVDALEAKYTIAHISMLGGLVEKDIQISLPDEVVGYGTEVLEEFEREANSISFSQEDKPWQ